MTSDAPALPPPREPSPLVQSCVRLAQFFHRPERSHILAVDERSETDSKILCRVCLIRMSRRTFGFEMLEECPGKPIETRLDAQATEDETQIQQFMHGYTELRANHPLSAEVKARLRSKAARARKRAANEAAERAREAASFAVARAAVEFGESAFRAEIASEYPDLVK